MSLVNELNWEKRLMKRSTVRKAQKRRQRARRIRAQRVSLPEAIHQFLTAAVWKQGHAAWEADHHQCAWCLKAILWVLLLMTWGTGDSEAERFQTARAFYVAKHQHSKRPGKTWEGFQKALRRLPMPVFRALATGLRAEIGQRWIDELRIGGWLPIGCDGSRLECPRTPQLERRLGQAGKDDSAPTMYLSALVLLPLGLLWSWRLDKGTASEHQHLRQLLPTLPEQSLLVADALYLGYDLYRSILQAGAGFLMRMSSRANLYTETCTPLERFREGWVYYWPQYAQEQRRPPIRVRLLRVRGKQHDVWLLTNLDRTALSRRQAGQVYRWRWRNEGLFRTYKRTLAKVKLRHRTVGLVFREAEGSLLALQLLLALAVQTMQQQGQASASPRQALLRIRGAVSRGIASLGPRQQEWYAAALEEIHGESPRRTSSKTARVWPRRKPHEPPKPPKLLRLNAAQKRLKDKTLQAA
jgi:hypothetical protein